MDQVVMIFDKNWSPSSLEDPVSTMDDCYETSAAGLTWVICSTVDLLRCAIRVDRTVDQLFCKTFDGKSTAAGTLTGS